MTSTDRFGIMLFFAACVHAAFLSLTFSFPSPGDVEKVLPPMEIILVHSKTREQVEDADYLAQANNEGGGESEEKVRPQDQVSTPTIVQEEGEHDQIQEAASPQDVTPIEDELITSDDADIKVEQVVETEPSPVKKIVTADDLLELQREKLQITSELSLLKETQARKPSKKSISARTQEYKYASYMESWRQKIERFGRLNYPLKLTENRAYGEALIAVSINADGSIYEIQVIKSSGRKIVDDAAMNIIRRAAPFARLPKEILKETDILEIVRTLVFEPGSLSSK